MATILTGSFPIQSAPVSVEQPLKAKSCIRTVAWRPRQISQGAGRGMQLLGHAIEYLADEFALECMNPRQRTAPGVHPRIQAIEMLKSRSREIYFSCPETPTMAERIRSWLRPQRA